MGFVDDVLTQSAVDRIDGQVDEPPITQLEGYRGFRVEWVWEDLAEMRNGRCPLVVLDAGYDGDSLPVHRRVTVKIDGIHVPVSGEMVPRIGLVHILL